MDAREQAQALVDELGKALGIEGLAFDEEGSLTLELDGQLVVTIGVEPAANAVALFAALLGSEGPKPASFLQDLLEANFMWRGGRGATLGIEPESGAVVLQQRLPLAGLAYPEFQAALEAFANTLADWTALADKAAGEGTRQATAPAAPPGPAAAVRFTPDLRA